MKKLILKIVALFLALVIPATVLTACDLKSVVEGFLGTGENAKHTQHVYDDGVITVSPTCTTDGEKTYKCKKCENTYTEVIPALGHSESLRAEDVSPESGICEVGGTYTLITYCSVCETEISREEKTVAPGEHAYGEWEITKTATPQETGERKRTCILCGEIESEIIPSVFEELDCEDYYAYNYLKTAENSANILYAYGKLVDAAENMRQTTSLKGEGHNVTIREFETAYHSYKCDYPQHFWVDNRYSMSYSGSIMNSFTLTYLLATTDERDQAKAQVEAKKDEILDGIPTYWEDVRIETEIHDRLILHNTYDTTYNAPHTHDLYGALVNGTSVCDGYAKAFQYLLYCVGIQCFTVSGVATSDGGAENHAWNVVRLSGDYYYVDVTWDDPTFRDERKDYIGHDYHNITTAEISGDHELGKVIKGELLQDEEQYFPVPDCTATKGNYFKFFGYTAESLTTDNCRTVFVKEKNNGVTKYFAIYFTCGNITESAVGNLISRPTFDMMLRDVFGTSLFDTPRCSYIVDKNGYIVTFVIT